MSDSRLPPTRFYWAVLDAGRLGRAWTVRAAARRRAGLDCLFEESLPVPIESVQTAYMPLKGDCVLACGMDRDELREVAAGADSLGPAAAPSWVAPVPDVGGMNLLTDELESTAVRSLRRRAAACAACAAGACALLVFIGLERRVHSAIDAARASDDACAALYSRVLTGPGAQPPQVRLLSELRTLRQTRAAAPAAPPDASEVLAGLLGSWPRACTAQVETLAAGPDAIALAALVPDRAGASGLIAGVAPPSGWVPDQPQVTAGKDGERVTLRFRRGVVP